MTDKHAFPSGDGEFGGGPNHDYGMTLRDYFAGQALIGLIDRSQGAISDFARDNARLAEIAFIVADAMMTARGKAGGE